MSERSGLLNGAPYVAGLENARGLHYGDGIFRTMLFAGHQWHDWDRQIDKLAQDGRLLSLDIPDPGLLREEANSLVEGLEQSVLKILLWRRASGRGYAPVGREVDRLLLCYPAPSYPGECWSQGVVAFSSPVSLAPQPRLAGIKHLNRLEQVLASRDWPDGVQEALMFSPEAEPVCGTRTNVFWAHAGCLMTPRLDRCGVTGVMRQRVLDLASMLGIPVDVGRHPTTSLLQSDEVFLTNSLIGIWPLKALDSHRWPAPGKLTHSLMRTLAHPQLSGPH